MPPLDFFGPSAADAERRPFSTSRLVNCYRESSETGAIMRQAPGMRRMGRLDGLFLRAMERINGRIVAAHAGKLWRVLETGEATELCDIEDDIETTVAGINGSIVACAAGRYFVRDDEGVLTEPTLGAFSSHSSLAVMGQRVILTERDGRGVQWSGVNAPETLGGLSFATAEQRDDLNIRGLVVGPEYWVFKETCIERWTLTGSADETTALAYIPGSLIPVGLKAFRLVTAIPAGVFFVGSDGRAWVGAPGGIRPVSTVPVETALAASGPRRAFHWRREGHEFCAITFADRPAWCLDIATGEWWERAQGDDLGPWQVVAAVECYGRQWASADDGRLFWLDGATYTDDDEPLHRRMVSTTLRPGRRFRVPSVEILAHVGRGSVDDYPTYDPILAASGTGYLDAGGEDALSAGETREKRTPQVMARFSRDSGHTFGSWQARSLGDAGQYETRAIWRALGQFDRMTMELACAEPLDIAFGSRAFVETA